MTKARTKQATREAPAAVAWLGAWTKVANAIVETGSIQAKALREARRSPTARVGAPARRRFCVKS
jgi:hypothetical protein